jgi:hypothetical protein
VYIVGELGLTHGSLVAEECARAEARDGGIWSELVNDRRIVGRSPYEAMAAAEPPSRRALCAWPSRPAKNRCPSVAASAPRPAAAPRTLPTTRGVEARASGATGRLTPAYVLGRWLRVRPRRRDPAVSRRRACW